ncbi:metallopeptidase TldD-related protein [Wolbachia endosymbiont of Phyllotreta cruciferae]|uniref:metallopeptidase TldD-related protein n=1 Tax=Wolbachia endosymbiont of Phyllotreta cruciferae TaxID=2886377 RepID=UPI003511F4DE
MPLRAMQQTFIFVGNSKSYNILIEDGILKGYMQDHMNAKLMGVSPTGNGRRCKRQDLI